MTGLEYTAVAVGEKELGYGLRAIEEDAANGLPVICANLYRDDERIFPASMIRKVGGTTVGIFSLLGEEPDRETDVEIRDPAAEGRAVLADLEGRCDYTILLAHMTRESLKDLLYSLDGVDLVIRGHAGRRDMVSGDCADTLGGVYEDLGIPVLFAGNKGKAIGRARVTFDGDGRGVLSDTTLIVLGRDRERDPDVASMMREFAAREGSRMREMSVSEFVSRDELTGRIQERYLGMATCSRCHYEISADFMTTPHFRAFASLTVSGDDRNERCLACHTTGYGRFSGYSTQSDQKGGTDLRGVQCEACHGPGTTHTRDGKYSAAAKGSCLRCHTPSQDPDFDMEEMMKQLTHCHHADSTGADR
ncbi:MAG TPA: multiheme c-type cytochrome [Candidatus Krumholzibacterium sp.]|nr:multiheme c-type cytochrome [Candidatus Krumholzibacterium sp.]